MRLCAGKWWAIKPSAILFFFLEKIFQSQSLLMFILSLLPNVFQLVSCLSKLMSKRFVHLSYKVIVQ